MGASFESRVMPWHATINLEDVHSGVFLALSKIRGRWGGFETLEKWVTGALAGHTAVCLKDESGITFRKEIAQLQNNETAMKKAATKLNRRPQVDDEIAKLSSDLKEK
ncbi:hypothetical protein GIB67_027606 [Kingdonia uniflora]|uniref:Uncharacterized protein n=1 Tax=Kingdonia uniflora TaxID=39325 RepID=A0A7J7NLK7_9MAGN|nr:hypothetical protein GIB67_027606 [Kingdonia uniflora]